MPGDKNLVPVFMPALCVILVHAEDKKGEPLTHDEVIRIRDNAACMMMSESRARKLDDSRGYRDIDPENCWYEWQHYRRELGRKPDLDPGPRINQIRDTDPAYQQTIRDAHATLGQFRDMLPADGSPRFDAMVKTLIKEGKHHANMWLCNARIAGKGGKDFVAELFEISDVFKKHQVGDEVKVSEKALLDWMVNDNGVLHGGYSIRYYRSTLPEDERAEYDEHIGVVQYV